MGSDINVLDITYQAYGDLRSNQFYSVEFQADKIVQRCSAVTALACGIIQNNPNSGEMAVVRHAGKSKYRANGSVTIGQLVGPTANGGLGAKLAGTNTTHYVLGIDVATASSGDVGLCIMGAVPARAA